MNSIPTIKKLGTIDLNIVEANPILFHGKPYLMEYMRSKGTPSEANASNIQDSYFRFLDLKDMKTVSAPFGQGLHMGNAFVKDDRIIVTAIEYWGGKHFYQMESEDMIHWSEPHVILEDPSWEGYNTSICQADDRYILAFELGAPADVVHEPFTMFFAESRDLMTWRQIPDAVFGQEIYTGAPMLRYHEGFFYFFYLDGEYDRGFNMAVVRSKDLKHWEFGNRYVLEYSPEDKMIHPLASKRFTQQELTKIAISVDVNASDMDMLEVDGKLQICYSWGDQRGTEFLALAQAECTEAELCKSFFHTH